MLGLKVNWYRNHAEKKRGIIKGTGELLKVTSFDSQEGVAVINSEDGELEEIDISLVKVVKPEHDHLAVKLFNQELDKC